jgi:predicted GH43/DUF377 family glycosyl hydrolase
MIYLLLLLSFFSLFVQAEEQVILQSKRIFFPAYPDAFNPSLMQIEGGFLLSFRYCPDRIDEPWISFIGIVPLDSQLEPTSEPQLLTTRCLSSQTPSQSEDPRVFSYRGRTFVIFNDNVETTNPSCGQRRDMYLAELFSSEKGFSLSSAIKLIHKERYNDQWWQKNWVPFESNKTLFFVYSIDPHRIIQPNLINGKCYPSYETKMELDWNWGSLRGSTPPQLVDGEYLAFFHSGLEMVSEVSEGESIWHYFMGAYTFSREPPFRITKITPAPIIGDGFYTKSLCEKRVIFPGGYVVSGPHIYIAYGKDDREMWIATLDKESLLRSLKSVR